MEQGERKRLSKSNTFRGINVHTLPCVSKGEPDSKLIELAVQSSDTSIRISNFDYIDRFPAAAVGRSDQRGIQTRSERERNFSFFIALLCLKTILFSNVI